MLKKSLLIMLLMALFAPWVAQAQTTTVTIGDESLQSSIAPIATGYNCSATYMRYYSNEIGGPGSIQSIAFNYASSGNVPVFPIYVYMKQVNPGSGLPLNMGSLYELDGSTPQLVFQGTYQVSGQGWNSIILDTPFIYDGTSDLLVIVLKENATSYTGGYWYCNNNNVSCGYLASDWPYQITMQQDLNPLDRRPDIQFNIIPTTTVSIETGTLQSSVVPIATEYSCSMAYMRYRYNEIAASGSIQSIAFNYAGSGYSAIFPIKVYMKHISPNSGFPLGSGVLNELDGTTPQLVYDGNYQANGQGWRSISLDTPFIYDGVNDLLVIVIKDEASTYSGGYWYCTSNNTCCGYVASWAPYNLNSNADLDPSDRRPDIQFNIIPDECEAPTSITTDPTYISWQGGSGTYNVEEYGGSGGWHNIVSNYTGTLYYHSLNDGYQYRVQSVCGNNVSDWVTTTFYMPQPNCLEPYNFIVNLFDDDGTTVELSWETTPYNMFLTEPDSVQLCLNYDMDNLITLSSGPILYDLTGLTPGTSYTVQIRGVCSNNTYTDWSTSTFTTPGSLVSIGDESLQSSIAPIATGYNCSATYMRYYSNEIGGPGSIQSIAFNYASSGNVPVFPIYVYMKQVNPGSGLPLNMGSLYELDGSTPQLVFQGTYQVSGQGWNSIILDTPFIYDGTSDLLVIVLKENATSYTDGYWYCNNNNVSCGYLASDWPYQITMQQDLNTLDRRPDIQFGVIDYNCPVPTGFEVSYEEGMGLIAGWNMGGYGSYNIEINGVVTENINCPFVIGGEPGETYTVRVQTNCDYDMVSDWTEPITITIPTPPLTVNDGAESNSQVPLYGYWVDKFAKSQFIIPASELQNMTYGTINKLTFYADEQSVQWGAAEFEVYLTEVNYTSFETANLVDWSTMTKVKNSDILSISDNIMEITLDIPYEYGGGNLLIGLLQTVKGTYGTSTWSGENQTENTAIGGYENSKALSIQQFLPKTTFDYTPGTAPSCIRPTDVAISYTGGAEATLSWNGNANIYNIDLNGNIIEDIIGRTYTFTELELGTNYQVKVQAVCGENDLSNWSTPVNFTTDLCALENMCELTFELTDSYGDGWSGNAIRVTDVATGVIIAEMTNENLNGTSGNGENEVNTLTLAVCDGREIQFSWVSGSYATECSYVVTDVNGNEIFSGSGAMSEPVNYTVDCTTPCNAPTNLEFVYSGDDEAVIYWQSNATAFNLDVNGTVTENINYNNLANNRKQFYLNGLDMSTAYEVKVQAVCDATNVSEWSDVINFTTDMCYMDDKCGLYFSYEAWTAVGDQGYDNGMGGAYIEVIDVASNTSVLILDETAASGPVEDIFCQGQEIQFVWHSGEHDELITFEISDNGGTILSGSPSLLAQPFNHTVNCTMTCGIPTNFRLSYSANTMANFWWDLQAPAYNLEVNGEVTNNINYTDNFGTSANYTIEGLETYTSYTVRLQAVCSDNNLSEWTEPITFTTTCEESDMCGFNMELICNNSTGFQDGYLEIYDTETNELLWTIHPSENPDEPLPWSHDDEFFVCTGREVQFVWWGPKTSDYTYVLSNDGGEELASGLLSNSPFNYTANCGLCVIPTNLVATEVTDQSATISWEGTQTSYKIRYMELTPVFSEGFEGLMPTSGQLTWPDGWTDYGHYQYGEQSDVYLCQWNVGTGEFYNWDNIGAHSGEMNFISYTEGYTFTASPIWTPTINLSGYDEATLTFWYLNRSWELFEVDYRTDPEDQDWLNRPAYWTDWNVGDNPWQENPDLTWVQVTVPLPELSANYQVGFVDYSGIGGPSNMGIAIDDVVVSAGNSSGWQTVEVTGNTFELTGLNPESTYVWQVQAYSADCPGDGWGDWTESACFNTAEAIIVQEVTVTAGTNWYNFEVNITLAELQAALVAAMDEAGVTVTANDPIIIKTKDKTTRYNGSIWRGNLTELAPNEMYMITLPGSGEIQLEGTAVTPEENLTIHFGTNWFVFPADQNEMTLNNALAGFAVAGDKIKTKDATATCYGSFWRGNLTKLQPGESYIYESVVDGDRVLVFPTSK